MRTFAIAILAFATAALGPSLCDAKTTHHPPPKARAAAKAAASPITTDQAKAVAELVKTGLSIQADLNDAIASVSGDQLARRPGAGGGSVPFIECFQVLEGAAVELTGNLKELMVASATASLAKDQGDLATSLSFTRLALQDVGDSVALVQKVTSDTSPACRSSLLYRDQVGKLQRFAHDVTGVTDDLSVAAGPQ